MISGYSQKPLTQKLGIKQGYTIILLHQPKNYGSLLYPFPENCSIYDTLTTNVNLIQFFTKDKQELETIFPKLKRSLVSNGSIWISWPKKTAKNETDLNENSIREIGLKNGLVDVKVIAVDEIWSALKFVYRSKDRK